VVLLALLFGTQMLRGEPTSSRWRDRVWLSWMAVVVYLLHNVEEYGVDLLGQSHAFPAALCANLGFPTLPDCPVHPSFFLAVNISLFGVVGPIGALLSRRHPLVGLVVPVGVLEPDLEHGVASERQSVAAGCQADHTVPGGVAASACDEHPRRHVVLLLKRPQL